MNGKLIVLEGIDGSGKATQSGLLEDHLIKSGKDVMHISFPDYGSPSSALVKMYLNGDFGRAPGGCESLCCVHALCGGSFCFVSNEVEIFL